MRWLVFGLLSIAAHAQPGRDWGIERKTYADPVTGVKVIELTGPGWNADNLYFHFSNFTADNRFVLFTAAKTGRPELYRYEVETGRIVQITDDPQIAPRTACPHPQDPSLAYLLRGPEVLALDIRTGATRRVGEIPEPRTGGYQQPTISHDGKSLALVKQRDPANWEIGLMNIATGAWRSVVTQGFRIGHVQHSPSDPVIFYVWETGGYAPQRSWLVNDDGTGNRPFYQPVDPKKWITPLKEWLTHEAWIQGTGQMTMINDKVGVMVLEKDGTSRLVREGNDGHAAATSDGKRLAIDDAEGRIWIAETATGNIRLLATGIRDKVRVHGHTSFDRRGRYIQFHTGRTHETVALIDLEAKP